MRSEGRTSLEGDMLEGVFPNNELFVVEYTIGVRGVLRTEVNVGPKSDDIEATALAFNAVSRCHQNVEFQISNS